MFFSDIKSCYLIATWVRNLKVSGTNELNCVYMHASSEVRLAVAGLEFNIKLRRLIQAVEVRCQILHGARCCSFYL